jgi:hypothetical protein
MRSCEFFAQRESHVFHVAARTVNQDDGRIGAGVATTKTELGHVKPDALDFHELAGWRMRSLDACHAEPTYRHEHAKHNCNCDDGSRC